MQCYRLWLTFAGRFLLQWNDALATLDPEIVASRYATDAGKYQQQQQKQPVEHHVKKYFCNSLHLMSNNDNDNDDVDHDQKI
jgi:hypothetical protein